MSTRGLELEARHEFQPVPKDEEKKVILRPLSSSSALGGTEAAQSTTSRTLRTSATNGSLTGDPCLSNITDRIAYRHITTMAPRSIGL